MELVVGIGKLKMWRKDVPSKEEADWTKFWVTDGESVWPAVCYVNEDNQIEWIAMWDSWDFVWDTEGDWDNIIAWQPLVAPEPPNEN